VIFELWVYLEFKGGRMLKKFFVFLLFIQLFAPCLYADNDYNALSKLARGGINTVFSFLEIPRQMIKVNQNHGDIAGIVWGPLKGIACFVGRTIVGVYESATFLIPSYKPALEPEFIFSELEEDN